MMKQNTRLWKKPDTPRPVKPYKPETGELCHSSKDGQGTVSNIITVFSCSFTPCHDLFFL